MSQRLCNLKKNQKDKYSNSLPVEIKPKNKSINIRVNEELVSEIKRQASEDGICYQKWIRLILGKAIS